MFWHDKTVWQEGMFLRAQHFQQQDRHAAYRLQARTEPLRVFPWGFTEAMVNRELLGGGLLALSAAAGVLPDGTPFAAPGHVELPPPLNVQDGVRNMEVFLALPLARDGVPEVSLGAGAPADLSARYTLQSFEALDTHSDSAFTAEIGVGQLALRYLLECDDPAGYARLGFARIVEVQSDRRIVLDDSYVPACLRVSAAAPLASLLLELVGMLDQRAQVLAARLGQPGARGVADVANFLLLQALNRWKPLLAHWAGTGYVHPEDLYSTLLQIAGELATFSAPDKLASSYPAYLHADLQGSFAPVIADLRRALAAVLETSAVAIPLDEPRYGIRVGALRDRNLLRNSQFVLAVSADLPGEQIRRLFPNQVKVGAVEHIKELVNVALPGIAVLPLPVAPQQIPFRAGAAYFELDRSGQPWQQMSNSGGFGIHVSAEFPNLRMELWAIRA